MIKNYFKYKTKDLSNRKKFYVLGIGILSFILFFGAIQTYHIYISSPLPAKIDRFYLLKPKLKKYFNTYSLKKQQTLISVSYASDTGDYTNAPAYIVVDFDSGEVLAEKNISKKFYIASLTKIMSAIITLDLAQPDEVFTVSSQATHIEPTIIAVSAGEKLTVHELLEATLMTSANDAAAVIQEGIDKKYHGSVFIKAMNEKARFIGLTHTHFENPEGFDSPSHYSSVEDLAILTHYALQNYPEIADIVKKSYDVLPESFMHKEFKLNNWNGLLGVYPGVIGMKIGNTNLAGKTMIVVSNRNGKNILVVLLGSQDIISRDLWTAELLDYAYEKTMSLPPINVTEYDLRVKYQSWYS